MNRNAAVGVHFYTRQFSQQIECLLIPRNYQRRKWIKERVSPAVRPGESGCRVGETASYLWVKRAKMPKHSRWVVHEALPSPGVLPDGGQLYAFVFCRQTQGLQVVPKTGHVFHFQKDHRIVYPVADIAILQVKGQSPGFEYRHVGCQNRFLETEVPVEVPGYVEVFGPDEGADGDGFILHGIKIPVPGVVAD